MSKAMRKQRSLDYDSNYIARWQTVCLVFVNESGALEQVIRVWPWISRWWGGERPPECQWELRRDTELRGKSAPGRKGITGQQLIIYSFMQIVSNTHPHKCVWPRNLKYYNLTPKFLCAPVLSWAHVASILLQILLQHVENPHLHLRLLPDQLIPVYHPLRWLNVAVAFPEVWAFSPALVSSMCFVLTESGLCVSNHPLMFDLDHTFGPQFCGCLFVDSVASSLLCMGCICIFIVTVAREIFNSGCIIAPERKANHFLRVQFSEKCGISFQCLAVVETKAYFFTLMKTCFIVTFYR